MDSSELLRQALGMARNGRKKDACDLFQQIVLLEPDNEMAWIWLSGLLEPLDDRIWACERVLSINPANDKVRAYMGRLLKEQKTIRRGKASELAEKVQQVRWLLEDNRREDALSLLQSILREDNSRKDAWLLFAELSVNIHDKVRAYTSIVQHDPSDKTARALLKRYTHFQRNPMDLAAYYEENGEQNKALEMYQVLAAEAKNPAEFDRIYKNIERLEDVRVEKIRHVRSAATILRLSAGFPLLYIFEILIQEGLNPIRHPAPHLWIGIPLVIAGGFLLAVSGVRSRHVIWRRWFGEQEGSGSSAARVLVAIAGWFLVLMPHVVLALDSVVRMQTFAPPLMPWIQ